MRRLNPSVAAATLRAAIYVNSFRSVPAWADATGFRGEALNSRSLSFGQPSRSAEEFLVNSRLIRSDRESEESVQGYFTDTATVMLSLGTTVPAFAAEIRLPPSDGLLKMSLSEAVGRRRSRRAYTGDQLKLSYLSAALAAAGGITATAKANLTDETEVDLDFRTVASGGGLYPVAINIASHQVEGLADGIYRYDPVEHALASVRDTGGYDELLRCFAIPEELISISRANAIFLLTGKPWKSMRKYGSRGMRFAFLEAGAIAQQLHLACTALGLGSVDCAGIYDDEVHRVLGIDGVFDTLLHVVVAGLPA